MEHIICWIISIFMFLAALFGAGSWDSRFSWTVDRNEPTPAVSSSALNTPKPRAEDRVSPTVTVSPALLPAAGDEIPVNEVLTTPAPAPGMALQTAGAAPSAKPITSTVIPTPTPPFPTESPVPVTALPAPTLETPENTPLPSISPVPDTTITAVPDGGGAGVFELPRVNF